ncbi:prepilin-type N-terminal cleavage/methylation domain-containing protein [Clostridium perfringens]|uniref:Prepilin-type cleavage/methylation protein n=1 Tax=Clostridium perfringens TaxID=1502 RepID=A0A133MNG3_CLOPF|nr:prepilin-type N-terminal cleavage/methylation domain-containing protein [Clostridium perfringens]KXA05567.1 prepilin-type cleavage/methylation protein [Clostridium perfringens]MBS5919985.1 prepilin-type N-terminal cleavage/methylation domain-containing protein [Clostridium perfringens]
MNTKKQNKKKKGFTLIELIVVIAIIAILAAIAIPNFLSIQRKARVKADVASAKTIYDATSALIAQSEINPIESGINGEKLVLGDVKEADKNSVKGKDILAIENYLNTNGKTVPTSQAYSGKNFAVEISGKEDSPIIKVFVMNDETGTELYPEDKVSK